MRKSNCNVGRVKQYFKKLSNFGQICQSCLSLYTVRIHFDKLSNFGQIRPFCLHLYRRTTNLRCGCTKSFSSPPYSLLDFVYLLIERWFGLYRAIDAAPPRRFLNFYLEPPKLPLFDPQITTLAKVKKSKKNFSYVS